MYICMYICMYTICSMKKICPMVPSITGMYAYMYVCTYVCINVCMVHLCVYKYTQEWVCICMYVYTYVCVQYAYIYIYIYAYIIHDYIYIHARNAVIFCRVLLSNFLAQTEASMTQISPYIFIYTLSECFDILHGTFVQLSCTD
jgi:hypothetical protein